MSRMRFALAALAVLLSATTAQAQDRCRAPLPTREGQTFSDRVDWIIDGDGLCVTTAAGMVEVRLADFDAPEVTTREGREDRAPIRPIPPVRNCGVKSVTGAPCLSA